MYDEEYPPHHLDLSQVQHRANPQPRPKRQSQQVREYKRNSRGVHGRGNHNYTLRSVGGKKDADADQEAMIRAALIIVSIGTCGLLLPLWLTWEIIHACGKKPQADQPSQRRADGRQDDNDQWADPILLMGDE